MTDDLIARLRKARVWPDYSQSRVTIETAHEAADRIEALTAEVERLRGLLREAEVKLTDVQGAYATKRYADNLLARIRAALAGVNHE